MPKTKDIIQSIKWNLIIVSFICLIATLLLYFAEYGGKLIMIKSDVLSLPIIITLITFSIYGLSRFIGKRYNWIISLIGILIMLYISLPIFFGALK